MRHTLTITKVVLSGALLGVIILITLVLLRQFTNVGKSMLVQEKLESFIASKKAAVKLSEIFPWPWERLCSTGDIASKEAFEDALGRDDTIRESLRWYWDGSWMWPMSEGTDNLIFIGPDGKLDVYQYIYFGKAPINFPVTNEKRTSRCVFRGENLIVTKKIGSKDVVTTLNVMEINQ